MYFSNIGKPSMHSIKYLTALLLFSVFYEWGYGQIVVFDEVEKKNGHLYITKFVSYVKTSSIISFDSARELFGQNRFEALADEKIIDEVFT